MTVPKARGRRIAAGEGLLPEGFHGFTRIFELDVQNAPRPGVHEALFSMYHPLDVGDMRSVVAVFWTVRGWNRAGDPCSVHSKR